MIYPADSAIHRRTTGASCLRMFLSKLKSHGDCRKIWLPPVEGPHGQGLLTEFKVDAENFETNWKNSFSPKMRAVVLLDLTKSLLFQPCSTRSPMTVYTGMEFCIALEVALAMSGSEACC